MNIRKELLGELIGTFILVFIGCSSIVFAVVFDQLNLIGVASIWGIGVALAIYATARYSHAHLNPAVTLSMILAKRIQKNRFAPYFAAQLAGAFLASSFLFILFNGSIIEFEHIHSIVRGDSSSIQTAQFFGEFYPNPGFDFKISWLEAFAYEGIGTFLLLMSIFLIDRFKSNLKGTSPLFIGLTVSILIIFIAPFTQAGINPARDFGPRLFAWIAGWKQAAFPVDAHGFFSVYILAPLLGGAIAATFVRLFTDKGTNEPRKAT